MTIPASRLVRVLPGVLLPGGNALSLNGVFLTHSDRVPMGTVQSFPTLETVENFFGSTSIEAILAGKYFAGFSNALTLPGTIYFTQYNSVAVGAYLRSGSFLGTTLAQLQALSGVLVIPIDGRPVTSPNIDLSTATSFSNAADLIQAGLQVASGVFAGQGTVDDGAGGAGNTLTITAVGSGTLHVGDVVAGAGITVGTTITALGTGTGGVGTYTIGGAAQLVTPAVAVTVSSAVTVTYDAQLARFVIHSPTTGVNSTAAYATGSLSVGLKLTAATGAQLSPGAAAAAPAAFMPTVTAATLNWATFTTCFEPVLADKLGFALWVQTTNQRYAYVCWDSDPTPLAGAAPASFAAQCKAGNYVGIYPRYEPATDDGNGRKAAFICGAAASIAYDQPESRITFAYKSQPGLVPDITDAGQAENLEANGYNYYGAYATANETFIMEQTGSSPGPWKWFDPYVNQIWLNAQLQLALIRLMTQQPSIPYNSDGYNLYRQAAQDPIRRALSAGVIRIGVTLSNSQRAQVNTAADGQNVSDAITNFGYYLQILDAPPDVRIERGSPPMKLWYTDGGSIQVVDLASIAIQ